MVDVTVHLVLTTWASEVRWQWGDGAVYDSF
eukprot:COSAG02_NODE_24397_length_689_cov_1.615254_1_plen_30_part_10